MVTLTGPSGRSAALQVPSLLSRSQKPKQPASSSTSSWRNSEWTIPPAPRWHWRLTVVVIAVYILLSVFAVTTSSLGNQFRNGPDSVTIGPPQSLRSDEFMAGTPMELSMMETGDMPTTGPLSEESSIVQRIPIGPVQHLVFWDTTLLKVFSFLPDAQHFAANWWLSTLVLLLALPYWIVLMGGRWNLGWAAAFLAVFSPANWWWTHQISDQMGFTVLGCVCLLLAARYAERRSWKPAVGLGVLAAILLAGIASRYLVWSLILGGGLLLTSGVKILARWNRRSLANLGGTAILTMALVVAILWEGRRGMAALSSAVYPGQRLTTGEALDMGWIFSANFLFGLNRTHVKPVPMPGSYAGNISELATSWNFLLIIIPFVLVLVYQRQKLTDRLPEIALGIWCLIWFSWSFVGTGGFGVKIPLLNSVPAARTVEVVGALISVWLMLSLSKIQERHLGTALAASATVALLLMHSGSELLVRYLPRFSYKDVIFWAFIGTAVTFIFVYRPRRTITTAVAAALGISSIAATPPIQLGLGSFRGTDASNMLREAGKEARANDELWVADSMAGNALLIANGVPTLSGLLRSGPVDSEWQKLDPDNSHKKYWSRGGGYIFFDWSRYSTPIFSNPNYDVVQVLLSPCELAQRFPNLTTIVSTRNLSDGYLGTRGFKCLEPAGTFTIERWAEHNTPAEYFEPEEPEATAQTIAPAEGAAPTPTPTVKSGTPTRTLLEEANVKERARKNQQYIYKIVREQ